MQKQNLHGRDKGRRKSETKITPTGFLKLCFQGDRNPFIARLLIYLEQLPGF